MTDMRRLIEEASRLGVHIVLQHIDDPTLLGYYDHEKRVITVDLSLTLALKKETIAHELGHCYYGDPCSSPTAERRADKYAAMLLVELGPYITAEMLDLDPAAIAAELGVTQRMIRVFQKEHLPTLSLSRRLLAG